MHILTKRPYRLAGCLLLFAACAAGCSSTALTHEKLDPVTSVTVRYSEHPLVFFRRVPGRAALAHDHVNVAPIEINRSGAYRHYVWLGIWTTDSEAEVRSEFETITISADGEALRLEVMSWTAGAIGVSEPVYSKTFPRAVNAYYEISIDQLRRLAGAADLHLHGAGSDRGAFKPWNEQVDGKAALMELVNGPTY
jgi:hypothetical protein